MRRALIIVAVLVAVLLLLAVLVWRFDRRGLDDYAMHLAPPAPMQGEGLRVSWFGVSAVLIEAGDHALFIDPFFSRPGGLLRLLSNPAVAPDEALIRHSLAHAGITQLDAVLVSHSHYDHAMDAGVVAQLTGAVLAGSPSTLNIGRGAGLSEDRLLQMPTAEPWRVGPWTVHYIDSRHAGATGGRPTGDIEAPLSPPARLGDYRQGGTFSILIEHDLGRILHHGSAGFEPGALGDVSADTVILGVALIDELDRYLAETVDAVGARSVIPVHWDDFTRPLSAPLSPMPIVVDLRHFFAHMRTRPDLRVLSPGLGQAILLPASDSDGL